MTGDVAVIAIGRNEGDRLKSCLRSLPADARVIYVDSGSSDGSLAFARGSDVELIELDMSRPFTAARARNAGIARLDGEGEPEFIQTIDGDCALAAGWLEAGRAALHADPRLAVVFGRRRERDPGASVWNALIDDEWNVSIGEQLSCGGDALFRTRALLEVGGYSDGLIAGEEPDLCLRLRRARWRVRRIDAEMTLHDAAMTRIGQWWRRNRRAGHAFAELAFRHRDDPAADPNWRRQVRSDLAWGAGLPLAIVAATLLLSPLAALALLLYPLQAWRIARRRRREGLPGRLAAASGATLMLGKFAQLGGVLRFHLLRLRGGEATLIEYKGAEAAR